MSRKCEICGKRTISGNKISHAHNKTRRVWMPNLIKLRALVKGRTQSLTVCARCLRAGKVEKVV
ncbi:MAG: 50S ribosomal protein L28 [Spirochaetales bacterium]|nr:50S ribosomal protein L28 [Spirochaetales bacterium]